MRVAAIFLTTLLAGLMLVSDARADDFHRGGIYSGLPYFGYGYSGSLYGLGRVPVPPYFALHPPVYYSHEIRRRPVGDSPYAYSPERPIAPPRQQCMVNPFIPDPFIEDESQQTSEETDLVAQVMQNPFYRDEQGTLPATKMIYNPFYAKSETVVAQIGN